FNFYDCLLLYFSFYIYFFCSSRRRDTNLSRDWSSDVCSSDLRPTCCATSPTSARAGRTFAWRWTSRASRTPERAAPMPWRAVSPRGASGLDLAGACTRMLADQRLGIVVALVGSMQPDHHHHGPRHEESEQDQDGVDVQVQAQQ